MSAFGGKADIAHARKGAADRGEHREAAGTITQAMNSFERTRRAPYDL
jgi:hypothetical protein